MSGGSNPKIAEEAAKRRRLYEPDDHFLSPFNPLVTVDQRDVEAKALALYTHPIIEQGKAIIAERWRRMVGNTITEEAEARFAELVEEFSFAYVLLAVNGDPNYPKVTSGIYGPPHSWMGQDVIGARGSGGDGPDQSYSFIPIEYGPRFEIHGQRFDPSPGDTPYMQSGDVCFNMTLSMLQSYDIVTDADGRFVITLDPEPANGRPNHIQTEPNARYIFIRECRNDWREIAAKHRVVRLDPPSLPQQTDEQIAGLAVHNMSEAVPKMFWFMNIFRWMEPNKATDPFHTGNLFGMVTQAISFMRVSLTEDIAILVTVRDGGAAFRNIVLHDYWFRTLPYWKHTSNLNPGQSVNNPDGSTTYVISLKDPGVHNWLSPAGFHDTLFVNRWQALPADRPEESRASIRSEIVPFDRLADHLPEGTRYVTPAERAAQIAEREATFLLRYTE